MLHALWIDWREQTLQTTALLSLAGALKQHKVEPDAHQEFDDQYGPPRPVRRVPRQDPEERMRIVAALTAR